MSKSLLFTSRIWHRRIASILFVFFFIVAATGLMLGWKSLFTQTIFEDKGIKASKACKSWLPLDSLERLAAASLSEKVSASYDHAERVEIRVPKGYIDIMFKGYYYVQVDGATGKTLLIEKKNGGWILDLHDGAIVDGWVTNKLGIVKKTYTTVIGLALLLLTISGFYLWYKPRMLKKRVTSVS